MFQIDNASAATTQPASTPPGTAGFFTDGNPATSVPATIVPAEWLNSVMMELMNVLSAAGIAPNKSAFNQVASAIRGISRQLGGASTLNDTGAVNAYAAVNPVPLTAGTLVHGVRQRVTIANTNTGASTYAPDGLAAKPVYGLNLQALAGGEFFATQIADLEYVVAASLNSGNGAWLLLGCAGGAFQMPAGSYGVTPAQFDNSAKLASTAFVQRALGGFAATIGFSASGALTAQHANKFIELGGSGPITVTLPAANAFVVGTTLTFYQGSAYTVTLAASGGGIVPYPGSNVSSLALPPNSGVTQYVCDGSNWIGTYGTGSAVIAANGFQRFSSGLILQWGAGSTSSDNYGVTFPIAFTSYCAALVSMMNTMSAAGVTGTQGAASATGFNLRTLLASGSYANAGFTYMAVGK